jgi:hypothetical protein
MIFLGLKLKIIINYQHHKLEYSILFSSFALVVKLKLEFLDIDTCIECILRSFKHIFYNSSRPNQFVSRMTSQYHQNYVCWKVINARHLRLHKIDCILNFHWKLVDCFRTTSQSTVLTYSYWPLESKSGISSLQSLSHWTRRIWLKTFWSLYHSQFLLDYCFLKRVSSLKIKIELKYDSCKICIN